jgi:uncharacterized protein YecE (DUF72 family)
MHQGSLFKAPPRDAKVRVGPAGWNYKDWEGTVYPAGMSKKFDALAYIAEYFDTVEINSSFYYPPRPADALAWARRARNNSRFKFTAKVWQRLTHEGINQSLEQDCDEVRRSMTPLAEAGVLGALLIQFPWSFQNTEENSDYLVRIIQCLREFALAVEVRHGSWDTEEFLESLRASGVAFCNIDQPVIGNSIKPSARVTSRIGYVRLHGRNYQNWFKEDAGRDARYDYLYSRREIGEVVTLIGTVSESSDEIYVITNNHFRGQAVINALQILQRLDPSPPAVPPLLKGLI